MVIVYFGWNDHWRATVKPDHEFPVPDRRLVSVQRLLGRARLYQALNYLLKGRQANAPAESPAPPFPGEEDAPSGAVISFHDVTERLRLDEIRRDFVANASHELRTPLTSIRGFVEALAAVVRERLEKP